MHPASTTSPAKAESGADHAPRETTGREALLAVGLRRANYIAHFLYWTARHRSISSARWVLAFEGIKW